MPEVFINYRTGDAEHAAAAIDTDLSHRFGPENVFFAGKSIEPSRVYDTAIIEAVRASSVLIVVIGPAWLAPDAQGRVRLHEQDDWVRREIREALQHGLHVLPVPVGKNVERITRGQLPSDIAPLADRQWQRYDHRESARCLQAIAKTVAGLVPLLADRSADERVSPGSFASNTASASIVHGSLLQMRDGAVRNNTSENSHNTARQTTNTNQSGGIGSIDGASFGTFFNHSNGPVNTGSGDQYNAPRRVRDDDGKEPQSA